MVIKISVYDDGQEPVTCSRKYGDPDGMCGWLRTMRRGTRDTCHLFSYREPLHRCGERENGYLIPHDDCLKARKDGEINIIRDWQAKMWDSGYCPINCPHLESSDSGFACIADDQSVRLEEDRRGCRASRHDACTLPRPVK